MSKCISLIGQRFGRLVVLRRAEDYISPKGKHCVCWWCKCDCRVELVVMGNSLKRGNTRSCGCLQKEKAKKSCQKKLIGLIGKRFGNLIVICRDRNYYNPQGIKYPQWLCRCDCGNFTIVLGDNLRRGNTKSCGCLHLNGMLKENNWNWRGGVTKLEHQIRISVKYLEWRLAVFKRDDYTCQYSGERGNKLNVHHLKPFSQILKENNIKTIEEAFLCKELWSVSNGVTLTKEKHQKFHSIYGNSCSLKDFKEWAKEKEKYIE